MAGTVDAQAVVERVRQVIERAVADNGGSTAPVRPGHRVPFHWPPHGISYDFHVSPEAWSDSEKVNAYGEELTVELAITEHGVFARVVSVWSEARAETREEAVRQAVEAAKPYYDRVKAITDALGLAERFRSTITDLPPGDLVALLYCPDRDVAYKALTTIERQASLGVFGPALIEILNDRRHPHRRSAQWCVLDMLEDVTAFFKTDQERKLAIEAIKDLILNATNDYARTVFKAGVVLGGHISDKDSADALIECLRAPSKFGRRSAIHAVFHLCEWLPDQSDRVAGELRSIALTEPEPALAEFARYMADDIERHATDHMAEPFFEDES